jgi:hypothetical protein
MNEAATTRSPNGGGQRLNSACTHTDARVAGPLVNDRGPNPCYLPPPLLGIAPLLGIGLKAPTARRAQGPESSITWRKRDGLPPYRPFAVLSRLGTSRKSGQIIFTTHPCSSPRPMIQPLLASTLSIADLHRRSDS